MRLKSVKVSQEDSAKQTNVASKFREREFCWLFFLTTQGRHRTEPFIIAPKKIEFKQIRAKIINLNHEQVYQFESMMHQNLTLMKIQ